MGIIAKSAGNALDPGLVRLFIGMLGLYPPRSIVQLDSGEIAVVIAPGKRDIAAPRVRIIADREGHLVPPVDVDLEDPAEAGERRIERCLDPAGVGIEVSDYL